VLKHLGIVYAVAFNPEGSRLATGCSDNIVHVWDTETCDEMIELRGHSSYVHSVAFSPDGTMLASGSGDFTVRIWDSRSPDERRGSPD
jgi:eukaryotic-like serine/threonine-protein kinase